MPADSRTPTTIGHTSNARRSRKASVACNLKSSVRLQVRLTSSTCRTLRRIISGRRAVCFATARRTRRLRSSSRMATICQLAGRAMCIRSPRDSAKFFAEAIAATRQDQLDQARKAVACAAMPSSVVVRSGRRIETRSGGARRLDRRPEVIRDTALPTSGSPARGTN